MRFKLKLIKPDVFIRGFIPEAIEPIERLVRKHTDASSLDEFLARDLHVIDCRDAVVESGREKFERDLLADVCDSIFILRGTRDADGRFKKVDDCCGDEESASGSTLDLVLEDSKDAELIAYRLAYRLCVRVKCGMSDEDAFAEVRKMELSTAFVRG